MWTETEEGRKYIEEISKRIVNETAPEELELFDELIAEYFSNPSPAHFSGSGKDDELAFGVGEVLVAVTPAAAAMVSTVSNYLISEASELIKSESAEKIKENIKAIFNPETKDGEDKEAAQPLTKDQLETIKKLARSQAKKFGMESKQANKMAEALIGALVLAA